MPAVVLSRRLLAAAALAAASWPATVSGVALLRGRTSRSNATRSPFDCYNGNGADYEGMKDMTVSGRTCKNWLEQEVHKPSTKGIGNHNFCRNPEGSKEEPWCHTVDPAVDFELCAVPKCPADGASPEPWTAPAGAKSAEAEKAGPCEYKPPDAPGYKEYKSGRACMDHRGETWWLISNSNFTVPDAKGCEGECKTLPGTNFFTYWESAAKDGSNCGCYRDCILVPEDVTVNSPTVYKVV